MPTNIVPFESVHIEDAALLVARRYRGLRNDVPSLPPRYEARDVLLSLIARLSGQTSGVTAIAGGQLVGFLLAMTVPDFRGRQTVFSPEWANAAMPEEEGFIYEQMVATLAADWYADGSTSFLTALFADCHAAAETFFRLGFGMLAMDAMRDLSPPQGAIAEATIARASLADLDAVLALSTGLCRHLQAAPTFLLQHEPDDCETLAAAIENDANRFWLAWQDGRAVAFMKIGPATEDASTIIRDAGTASITGAYALPEAREQGVGTALLARCIDWAREAGYVRCGVDFEPTNIEANRFWRRHFQPVSFGVQRLLNVG